MSGNIRITEVFKDLSDFCALAVLPLPTVVMPSGEGLRGLEKAIESECGFCPGQFDPSDRRYVGIKLTTPAREAAVKMQAEAFNVGDAVRLKHGGADMTVTRLPHNDEVGCDWFDTEGRIQHQRFPSRCLVASSVGGSVEGLMQVLEEMMLDGPAVVQRLNKAGLVVVRNDLAGLRARAAELGYDVFRVR